MITLISAGLYLAWVALIVFAVVYWTVALARRLARKRRPRNFLDNLRVLWLCRRHARRRKRNGAQLHGPLGPQRSWDWPEDAWPSVGGWADRERL